MEQSLDPPPHATHSPPRLRDVALAMLRLHWPAVRDVGDAPYTLLQTLLPLSSASQLADLEQNSPHLVPHTNPIWRQLCVNEFIEIRKAVEDGQISQQDEPESWKEQYDLEAIKREEKMQAIVSKMRGQINEYKHGRATTKEVDWRLEKRRKVASSSTASTRPKTLMEKARHNTKQIKSIYAPRRGVGPVPPPRNSPASAASGAPTSFAPTPPPPPPPSLATALSSGSLFVSRSPSRSTKGGSTISTSAAASRDQQQLKKRIRETTTTTTTTSTSDPSTMTLFNSKKPKLSNAPSSSSAVKITTATTTTTTTTLARKPSPVKRPLVVSSELPAKHQQYSGTGPRLGGGGADRKSEQLMHDATPALPSSSAQQPASSPSRPPFSPPPRRPPLSAATKKSAPMTALSSPPRPRPGPGLAPMLPPPPTSTTSSSNRPVVVPRGIFMPKSKR